MNIDYLFSSFLLVPLDVRYWCGPYHEWQKIYNYITDSVAIWGLDETAVHSILGSETLAWGAS